MRYYYDCPLKAAYMAKYFGMNFGNITQRGKFSKSDPYRDVDIERCLDYVIDPPFYIHPDSLHSLHPKAGDVLEFFRRYISPDTIDENDTKPPKKEHFVWIGQSETFDEWKIKRIKAYGFDWMHESPKIIQRNGITFMWPEVENE